MSTYSTEQITSALRQTLDLVRSTGKSAHHIEAGLASDVVRIAALDNRISPADLQAIVDAYADSGMTPADFIAHVDGQTGAGVYPAGYGDDI